MHRIACLAVLTMLVPLTACKDSAPPAGSGTASPVWLLTQAPADARTVGEIKPSAVEGDTVVLRGRIGGRKDPITPGMAVFIVIDPGVPSCDQIPGDNCSTPWDYCCEPRESLNANSATIQLVDEAGNPIAVDLAGLGLRPLDEVVVIGTIGPRPSGQILIVRATGMYRVGG
jgi:hypothetical protein